MPPPPIDFDASDDSTCSRSSWELTDNEDDEQPAGPSLPTDDEDDGFEYTGGLELDDTPSFSEEDTEEDVDAGALVAVRGYTDDHDYY